MSCCSRATVEPAKHGSSMSIGTETGLTLSQCVAVPSYVKGNPEFNAGGNPAIACARLSDSIVGTY